MEDFIRHFSLALRAVEHNSMVCRNDKLADVELTSCDKMTKIRMIFQDCVIWPFPAADHMNEALAEQNRMAKLLRDNEKTRSGCRYTHDESWAVPKRRVE